MNRIRTLFAVGAAAVLGLSAFAYAQQSSGVAHSANFNAPRVDRMADGQVIVSFAAGGDLGGLITLSLHPAENGSYAGEWAFMISTRVASDSMTTPSSLVPESSVDDSPHQDAKQSPHDEMLVSLVRRGSMTGAVKDAQLSFDSDGGLSDLWAPLSIGRGEQEFKDAAGWGRATLKGLTLYF